MDYPTPNTLLNTYPIQCSRQLLLLTCSIQCSRKTVNVVGKWFLFSCSFLPRGKKIKLSSVVAIMVNEYLPEQLQKYINANLCSSHVYRKYLPTVPQYLHNRPKKVISHCLARRVRSLKYEPGKYFTPSP